MGQNMYFVRELEGIDPKELVGGGFCGVNIYMCQISKNLFVLSLGRLYHQYMNSVCQKPVQQIVGSIGFTRTRRAGDNMPFSNS